MAGLDFLHNNFALEQNTRMSWLFSGANDDQYASFDRFFGQASNDPFAAAQGLDFDAARFRVENSFDALQQDFTTIHNDILNIETENTPVMLAYEEAPMVIIDQMFEPAVDDYSSYVIDDVSLFPDIASPSNDSSFYNMATGEALNLFDENSAEVQGVLEQESFEVIPDYAEPTVFIDTLESFGAMPEANLYEISVMPDDMAQEILQTLTEYAELVTTIDIQVDAPQEIAVIDHFADNAWQSSAMVIDMAHEPYDQSYTQSLFENVLNDMQIGAWDDMVRFDPEHLNYAAAANDPTNNVFTQDLALNEEGYSSQLGELQNLTSY